MLAGRPAARAPRTGARSSSCSRAGSPRDGGTASSPASGAPSTRSSGSASTRPTLAVLEDVVDGPTLEWLASYRFSGDVWGYAEGEAYFPYSPLLVVESTFAEAVLLETAAALDLQPRLGDRVGGVADDAGRRRPAVHRDGLASYPRGGGGGGRAGGVRRRLRGELQPRRPAAVRRADDRHQRAQLHAAARHRGATPSARRSTSLGTGTTLLVDTYDVAEAVRLAVEVAGTGLGAVRLDSGDLGVLADAGARAARLARRDRDPDHRDQRPRRVRDRVAGRGAGRRVRRRHPAGHRQRPPDLRVRLQAGRARVRRPASWCRWPRGASTRSRSAAASTRCAGVRRRRGRGRGDRDRRAAPVDDGDDRSLLVPLVRAGEVVGRESLADARDAAPRRRGPSCRSRSSRCRAASRSSRPSTSDRYAPRHEARADRDRRAERLLRGRLAARRGRRPGRGRHRRRCCTPGSRRARTRRRTTTSSRPRTTTSTPARTGRASPTSRTRGRCTAGSAPTARRSTPTSTRSRSTRSSSRASTRRRTPASRAARVDGVGARRLAARARGDVGGRLRDRDRLLRAGDRAGRGRAPGSRPGCWSTCARASRRRRPRRRSPRCGRRGCRVV